MSTREGLLTAITTNPGDDTPRLVYADYLDESGDPDDAARAKLIRTQIEASRLPSGDKSRAELEQLAEELWERYQTTWFVGVEPSRLPFPERGFITHWGCYSAEEIAADLRVTFQREPIISLTLSVSDPQELAGVETEPALARVQELSVWPGTTDDEVLFRFFSSPYLCGLRKLSIMGNWRRPWSPMPETVRVLATRPQYTSLREFDLTHADVGNSGASALAGSKILRLTSLSIGRCDIGMDGLRTVLASPVVSHVTSLGLGGDAGTAAEAEILADALATSAHLGQLEGLGIDETAFTDSAAARLARADWPALNRLTILPHNHTHSDQVTGLPTMTAQGIENLLNASWARNIESLDLSGQSLGDAGAETLARQRRLARLRRLTLMGTGFTSVGLKALTEAYAQQLELFQLARNPIGDHGAKVIADANWPAMVTAPPSASFEQRGLFVALCGLTDAGVDVLARSATIPRDIPDLFIGDVPTSDGVVALMKARYPKATIRF